MQHIICWPATRALSTAVPVSIDIPPDTLLIVSVSMKLLTHKNVHQKIK